MTRLELRGRNNTIILIFPFAVSVVIGSSVPWLLSLESDVLPFLFLGVISLPLLAVVSFRMFSGRPLDLFEPSMFFPLYLWIHVGWGTFLFMRNPIRDLELDPLILLLNVGAMYAYFSGLQVARALKGPNRKSIRSGAVRQVASVLFRNWSSARLRLVFAGGILLSLVTAAIFYIRAGGIPILFEDVQQGRVQAHRGNTYTSFVALSISYFYLVYWARHVALTGRLLTPSLGFFFIFAVMLQASFGYRNKVVWFVVVLLVAHNYLRRRIRVRHFMLVGLLLLSFVIVAGIWRASTGTGREPFDVTWHGLLMSGEHLFKRSTVGLISVTSIFPEKVGYRFGQVYLTYTLRMLLPGHQPGFGTWLKEVTGLKFRGGGITPSLVGEFYLNFGAYGVVAGFLLLGALFSGLYHWMREYPSPLRVLIYAVFVRNVSATVSAGFSGVAGFHLIWSVLLILLINWYVDRRSNRVQL